MVRSILQSNSALTASILLSFLCFTHSFCEAASGSQCFFSSGVPADRNYPCNPTETESFCCGTDWTCLPNRLCASALFDRKITLARGACTAKSWASTSLCPNFCLETPSSQDNGMPVTQCDDPNLYCCDYNKSCNCTSGLGTISIPGGPLPFITTHSGTVVISSLGTLAKETVRTTATTTATTTERTTEKVTETVVSSIAMASSTDTSSTSTTNALSIADPISSNSSSTTKVSPESKEGIKIGVAVGVSLGVLIIAFICIFGFWREKRLKKSMEELKSRWIPVGTYQLN